LHKSPTNLSILMTEIFWKNKLMIAIYW
jgi:hypothetical protein